MEIRYPKTAVSSLKENVLLPIRRPRESKAKAPPKPPRSGRLFIENFQMPEESNLQHLGIVVGLEERPEIREQRGLPGYMHHSVEEDYYVAVTGIIPGSLADRNGRFKFGDQIMQINGIDVKELNDGEMR